MAPSQEQLIKEKIETIGQLAAQPFDWFLRHFGKRAQSIWDRAHGEDQEPVQTQRDTKSLSAETTFPDDLSDPERLYQELADLTGRVARRLSGKELQGKTVSVKLRLSDYTTFSRQTTLPVPTRSEEIILDAAWRLLSAELSPGRAFRLIGIGLSSFGTVGKGTVVQLALPLIGT